MGQLILTVTRACNLRCSYCPTAKDGWPSLTKEDVHKAIDLFVYRFGGGSIKIFGGEPLLVPDIVDEAISYASTHPLIDWVYLSTNGLPLHAALLSRLAKHKKLILTLSMDGKEEDHDRMRRALPNVQRSYTHILSLLDELQRMPRLVVTQTIAPATAKRAFSNFEHLYQLGFRKFNFLPGYYIPWKPAQLAYLKGNFKKIASFIAREWQKNSFVYVRNLFVQAPTPFFNTGLIVDSDRSIHANNLGLSGNLDHLRQKTVVGDLDHPPSKEQLQRKTKEVSAILTEALPERILHSTNAVDALLTGFCKTLWPLFLRYKQRKREWLA